MTRVLLLLSLSFPLLAQAPALPVSPPPSEGSEGGDMLEMTPPLDLSPSAQEGLARAREWIDADHRPATGYEGEVVFTYGESLPTVVCAPLYPCAVQLQPGEVIRQADIGDAVRWRVTPARFSSGPDETTILTIKPSDKNLHTVLFISTDRRLYTIRVASSEMDWMPRVSFAYPESVGAAWARYYNEQREERDRAVLNDGNLIEELDFGFSLHGNAAWKPVRVYRAGTGQTYIQFPEEIGEMPNPPVLSLLPDGDGSEEIVNYSVSGDRYIVGRSFVAALLSDGQDIVEITYEGAQ